MHAGPNLQQCCSTVVGRLTNGSITLQVGGVGFHAVGALAPSNIRLTLLYNVVLVEDFNFEALPISSVINTLPALQVPPQVHDDLVALARNLVPHPITATTMSQISYNAHSRVSGSA